MTPQRTRELYLLEPIEGARHAYDQWQYDGTIYRMVIRATGHDDARRRAAEASATAEDAEPHVWLDPAVTSCHRLQDDGELGVVCVEVPR